VATDKIDSFRQVWPPQADSFMRWLGSVTFLALDPFAKTRKGLIEITQAGVQHRPGDAWRPP